MVSQRTVHPIGRLPIIVQTDCSKSLELLPTEQNACTIRTHIVSQGLILFLSIDIQIHSIVDIQMHKSGCPYREKSGDTGNFVRKIFPAGKNQGILQKHVREISGNFQLYIYILIVSPFSRIYIYNIYIYVRVETVIW